MRPKIPIRLDPDDLYRQTELIKYPIPYLVRTYRARPAAPVAGPFLYTVCHVTTSAKLGFTPPA